MNIGAVWEKFLEELADRTVIVVIKIHRTQVVKKLFDGTARNFKNIDEFFGKINAIECCLKVKLRIDEADVLQLHD